MQTSGRERPLAPREEFPEADRRVSPWRVGARRTATPLRTLQWRPARQSPRARPNKISPRAACVMGYPRRLCGYAARDPEKPVSLPAFLIIRHEPPRRLCAPPAHGAPRRLYALQRRPARQSQRARPMNKLSKPQERTACPRRLTNASPSKGSAIVATLWFVLICFPFA